MKYRVFCGFTDSLWSVTVEAESEEDARREGKRQFLELLDEETAFFASPMRPDSAATNNGTGDR